MNKKGQLDSPILAFVIIVIGLIILAPIVLKIFTSVQAPVVASLGNATGGAVAQANFNSVMNTAITFWDKVIVFAFFLGIVLLIVSAIFIDTNPLFIILYIMINFMLVLFAPTIVESIGAIYDKPAFATEVAQLTFMDAVRIHFGEFLVGIIVLTGIIIYGKIAFFRNQNTGGRA
jgi:hypothetical protein